MANRNITLSLPEDLLKQARIIAAECDTSVSRLVADALKEIVERRTGYEQARRRSIARLEKASTSALVERLVGRGTNCMTGDSDPRFVDSSVLIYAHDLDTGNKHKLAQALIHDLWESGRGRLSIQVLQEFFVTVTRRIPNPIDSDEAAEAIEDFAQWNVHAPTPADVLDAIAIHRRFDISFRDAMILNSASKLGCQIVYSEDLNAGQRYDGVRVVNPLF